MGELNVGSGMSHLQDLSKVNTRRLGVGYTPGRRLFLGLNS